MAMSHLLASSVSPLNSSKSVALMSTMLSLCSLSERGSILMGERKSGSEELGELGGEAPAGDVGRSKDCVWIRSPEGVVDYKW